MAWNISGSGLELCSCKIFCPCWLTPDVEPDEGWCAAVFAWDSNEGNVDGVDLGGIKFAMVADWPANFHKGGGTARLITDSATSAEQQTEIRSIFKGDKGGAVPALWNAVIDSWLEPVVADINVDWSEKTLSIEGIGDATMTPLTDANGNQAHLFNSVSQVAIGVDRLNLMAASGSLGDSELRTWNAADGVHFDFAWSG